MRFVVSPRAARSARSIVVLLTLWCAGAPAADSPPAVELFFRPAEYRDAAISPSGQHLAVLYESGGGNSVGLIDLTTSSATQLVRAQGLDRIVGFSWKSDERLIFFVRNTFYGNAYFAGINRDGSNYFRLDPGRSYTLVHLLPEDPKHILVNVHTAARRHQMTLLDIVDGHRFDKSLGSDPGVYSALMADSRGRVRVAYSNEKDLRNRLYYRDTENDEWKQLRSFAYRAPHIVPLAFLTGERELAVLSNIDRDTYALYRFDPQRNALADLLFEVPGIDLQGIVQTHDQRFALGVSYITDRRHIWYFDPVAQQLHDQLGKTLPEMEVEVLSFSADTEKVVVAASNDQWPGTYYLLDRRTGKLRELFDAAPWLKGIAMGRMKPIEVTARDGLKLTGYLTSPAGKDARNLPLIVIPHGGPISIRNVLAFDSETQFLASRGYAVLSINFRGSGGFGRAFMEAGYHQFGRKMQDDITDATRWAVAQGIADPKRIAILGGSYGGYSAINGLVTSPELFRCAAGIAGVYDLPYFFRKEMPGWSDEIEEFWERVIGGRKEKELLESLSPAFHVDRIGAPVFLAHGGLDPIVGIEQSKRLQKLLKSAHKDVEVLFVEEEGHGFARTDNLVKLYTALEKFFARCNPAT